MFIILAIVLSGELLWIWFLMHGNMIRFVACHAFIEDFFGFMFANLLLEKDTSQIGIVIGE